MSFRSLRISAILLLISGAAAAAEEYHVYTTSPRLFLRARRLRLLKREKERDSMRWRQFQALVTGSTRLPEPAFAEALYAIVSDDQAVARRAITDSRQSGDSRQIAFVLDWLGESMPPEDAKALEAKLREDLAKPVSTTDIAAVRTRVLAAIALSDSDPALSEKTLQWVIQDWWRSKIAPGLAAGAALVRQDEVFALYEMLHALRDNLTVDLRDNAADWFRNLPGERLLSYYPAPYDGGANEFRIPAFSGAGQPDTARAALSRVAELEMVAYDPNAVESQFLQGWLMQDRFLLRGPFGAPYEFLWANPYQPGLSYYHFPLFHHANSTGDLFARSSWDEDAKWFGLVSGEMQHFENGRVTVLDPARQSAPLEIGNVTIAFAKNAAEYDVKLPAAGVLFVVRLKPRASYQLKVAGDEARQIDTDAAGTLEVELKAPGRVAVRLIK